MHHLKILPVAATLAGFLSACATSNQPPPGPSAEGIIDPSTNTLNQEYQDSTFSLAAIVEKRQPGGIDGNDRRFIDQTLDEALIQAPAAPAKRWSNKANNHSGSVDLVDWIIDARQNEACGILNHEETFGDEELEGSVTICRSNLDPGWRIDTVSWIETEPDPQGQPKEKPEVGKVEPKPKEKVITTTTKRTGPHQTQEQLEDGSVITRTDEGYILPEGEGQQNIGDLLQDQAPHRPAN